jgi:hypothetical protein
VDQHAEEGLGALPPALAQLETGTTVDVDPIERAGDGVEAGGVNQDVELVLARGRREPVLGDALDRRLGEVDEMDVVPVVGLVVVVSSGTRCTPKPWSRGMSFSAVRGSSTRIRMRLAMYSENSALAASSVKISRKFASQMPKPGSS